MLSSVGRVGRHALQQETVCVCVQVKVRRRRHWRLLVIHGHLSLFKAFWSVQRNYTTSYKLRHCSRMFNIRRWTSVTIKLGIIGRWSCLLPRQSVCLFQNSHITCFQKWGLNRTCSLWTLYLRMEREEEWEEREVERIKEKGDSKLRREWEKRWKGRAGKVLFHLTNAFLTSSQLYAKHCLTLTIHVLQPYLPDKLNLPYQLRTRSHNKTLYQ